MRSSVALKGVVTRIALLVMMRGRFGAARQARRASLLAACLLIVVVSLVALVTPTGAMAATTGSVTGTVTDASTKLGVEGVEVCLYFADTAFRCEDTDANGKYAFAEVEAGEYKVGFVVPGRSPSLDYAPQFYKGKATLEAAEPVSVKAEETTAKIDAAMKPGGHITGKVTNAFTKAALKGIGVCATAEASERWSERCAETNASGEYTIQSLASGNYSVSFSGSGYAPQYYNGKASATEADPVAVTAGSTKSGINAELTATTCEASPAITGQPANQTVTAPAEATFKVKEGTVAPNCAPATIQWQVSTNGGTSWSNISGANFSGANSPTLNINPTSVSESGHQFRAVLTNAHGETNSEPATLTVTTCEASPAIAEQPANQTVTAPAGATFKVKEGTVAPNCSPATIQWQVSTNGGTSWSNVSGATSPTLKINSTSVSESGHQFRAVLTNAHGETNSDPATLTVEPGSPCEASPAIAEQPANQTVTAPAEATFKVKEGTVAPNCAPATIQWQVSTNGGTSWSNVSGATSTTLKINATSASESGHQFRAVLTNAHGETESQAATLTVTTGGSCEASPAIAEQPANQTVTAPAEATFKVKEGTVPAECSSATIQWQVSTNGGVSFENIPGATSATLKINPTSASESGHQFRAVLTNAHGETNSQAATLTVTTGCTKIVGEGVVGEGEERQRVRNKLSTNRAEKKQKFAFKWEHGAERFVAREYEQASCKITKSGTMIFRGLVEGNLNGEPEYVARYVFKITPEGETTLRLKIRYEPERDIVEEFETEELEESTEVIS